MKVECHINASCKEPSAVLHIKKMTPSVTEAISILEHEDANALALTAAREGKTYFLEPEELELVRTEGREIVCYDRQGIQYTLNKPLYELEHLLGNSFVRVSKSTIVHVRRIDHVKAGFNGTMELMMKNGIRDYISRSFRKSFKERLGMEG